MVLNSYSYVHKKIRKEAEQLEFLSGMKLVTDFSKEFVEVRYANKYGYIVLNWRREAVLTLSHKLTEVELELCKDIMLNLSWLETFSDYIYNMKGGSNYGNNSK